MELLQNIGQGLRTFASDVAQGFFEITHNGFALLGLVVVVGAGTALARPDLRQSAEVELMGWLQERHIATTEAAWQPSEPGAIERATAPNPAELPKQQAAVAFWPRIWPAYWLSVSLRLVGKLPAEAKVGTLWLSALASAVAMVGLATELPSSSVGLLTRLGLTSIEPALSTPLPVLTLAKK